ncbi:MAG: primosomal protein N', partial [Bacteroidaceae bacterium]|nr:primosomal protein N' [Bacteroidaceae bacterium]
MLTHTFVDVIVPLPLAGYFTYAVPIQWVEQVKVGCRVVVPFGNRKFYTAVVHKIHHIAPTEYKVKELYELLDMTPILLPEQLKLWQWMADYYLCTPGEVLKAALPSGLKVESETLVAINEEWDAEQSLTPHQDRVMQVLNTATEMTMAALMRATGLTNCMSIVKGLLEKRAVVVMESLKRNYKPKQEQRIKIASAFIHESALGEVCDKLERRSPKQFLLLMTYLEMVGETGRSTQQAVGKHLLLKKSGVSAAALTGLCKKGVLENFQVEIGHLKQVKVEMQSIYPLNSFQQVAFEQVLEAWQTKEVCLLHGVTSSGKTEVYIHLIHQTIERGEQVLYLLPEIALTTQITTRLRRVFGDKLGIYHSKFSDAERVDIWQKQLSENPFQVILGVRSSIFLPFAKLGLVIVDEEHEASYKQQDPAPRYHGRNVALVLAAQLGAKCLLGTATPSIESAYNAVTGKYGRVFINERYKSIQLPEVVPVDIKELYRKKRMKGMFSPLLIEEMTTALEKKEQIILFQNRRGFAPMVECKMCGWVPKCVNCDVSLTYHKGIHQLTCHY